MHRINTETAAELTTATFATSTTMADIAALPGADPALVAFRAWAKARDALLDDRPEGEKEDEAFRALVETKASGPAGIAALAAAFLEVFGGDEPALDAIIYQIIASATAQINAKEQMPERAAREEKCAPIAPRWVRVSEVQKYFGVSRATVYRAAQRGELTICKNRGSRVKTAEIERWLAGDAESAE